MVCVWLTNGVQYADMRCKTSGFDYDLGGGEEWVVMGRGGLCAAFIGFNLFTCAKRLEGDRCGD